MPFRHLAEPWTLHQHSKGLALHHLQRNLTCSATGIAQVCSGTRTRGKVTLSGDVLLHLGKHGRAVTNTFVADFVSREKPLHKALLRREEPKSTSRYPGLPLQRRNIITLQHTHCVRRPAGRNDAHTQNTVFGTRRTTLFAVVFEEEHVGLNHRARLRLNAEGSWTCLDAQSPVRRAPARDSGGHVHPLAGGRAKLGADEGGDTANRKLEDLALCHLNTAHPLAHSQPHVMPLTVVKRKLCLPRPLCVVLRSRFVSSVRFVVVVAISTVAFTISFPVVTQELSYLLRRLELGNFHLRFLRLPGLVLLSYDGTNATQLIGVVLRYLATLPFNHYLPCAVNHVHDLTLLPGAQSADFDEYVRDIVSKHHTVAFLNSVGPPAFVCPKQSSPALIRGTGFLFLLLA
eukprot:Hpha_TRINITY_DN15203_c0_g5::TRINITY_DN15203_c0_g5_i1::g.65324::m.65324